MLYVEMKSIYQDGDEQISNSGYGGDFLIYKANDYHGNDEAFKMAITDALGTAAKMVV